MSSFFHDLTDSPFQHRTNHMSVYNSTYCDLRDGFKVSLDEDLTELEKRLELIEVFAFHAISILESVKNFRGYQEVTITGFEASPINESSPSPIPGISTSDLTGKKFGINEEPIHFVSNSGAKFISQNSDLSSGLVVFWSHEPSSDDIYTAYRDFAIFHSTKVHPLLNGFRGYDCVSLQEFISY